MANRYWVGGSALWDNTAGTKWSTTSGGAGGASVPTTADDVFLDANSGAVTVQIFTGNTGAKSIDCTGFTGTLSNSVAITIAGSLTLSTSMTYSYSGTITFTGTGTITSAGKTLNSITVDGSAITVTLADNLFMGASFFTLTQGTLDLNSKLLSCVTFTSSNSNTRTVNWGTNGQITVGSSTYGAVIIQLSNSTNLTWTGTGKFYTNIITNNNYCQINVGPTNSPSTNAPAIEIAGGLGTALVEFGLTTYLKSIDATSFFGTFYYSAVPKTVYVYGDALFGGSALSQGLWLVFGASGNLLCGTNAGFYAVTIDGAGAVVTLTNPTSSSFTRLNLNQGTLSLNNVNCSIGQFTASGSGTKVLNLGTATLSVSNSGLIWDCSGATNLTTTGTGAIRISSALAKTFAGNGLTWGVVQNAGAGALTISGNNTFNTLQNTVQPATFTFTAGTTQTITNFTISGTAGNPVTINSTSAGSQATLSKSSGTVTASYLSIRDSNATGGAVWNALNGTNVNLGNNTGWVFPNNNMISFFM